MSKRYTIEISEKQRAKFIEALNELPPGEDDFEAFDSDVPSSLIDMLESAVPGDVTNCFTL